MDLLYQDDHVLVINKPAGLLTIRDGYNPLLPTVKSDLESIFNRCWIVHRLDKETSGVLIVALNKESHRYLNDQFQNHQIHKKYHAIVSGAPLQDQILISSPLCVNGDRRHRTVVDQDKGKPASSLITVLRRYQSHALLQIEPETGYTHQIRAHLSAYGYPILADQLYSKIPNPFPALIQRTALHAFEISFQHPATFSPITIIAGYPEDFQKTLDGLHR